MYSCVKAYRVETEYGREIETSDKDEHEDGYHDVIEYPRADCSAVDIL